MHTGISHFFPLILFWILLDSSEDILFNDSYRYFTSLPAENMSKGFDDPDPDDAFGL